MFREFLDKADQLSSGSEPFAMAMVVNRMVHSSGKPGDKAIIEKDGTLTGWIGGGCTRGIILKEASLALSDGKPRLIRISPSGEQEDLPGVVSYRMTCHSGGMVEVYIEPVMPRPHIVIMGKSHVAMALSRIASAMHYRVTAISTNADKITFPDADEIYETAPEDVITASSAVIVCTQGENDELSLLSAARSDAQYLAFVASRKKANAVFGFLRENGVPMDRLKEINTPAGLDINAKLPEEVAISILAQIIQDFRSDTHSETDQDEALAANENLYINPVCGVPVEKATAKHVINYKGENVYFCCDGCKVQFEAEPEKFVVG